MIHFALSFFLPSIISSSTHSYPPMTPSRPSVMCVPPRSPFPVPPGRLYLIRKRPSPLASFWQNGILANVLSPPLTIFLGVRFGAARRESRDPKSQPGSLPVLDRWTQAKAWDLQVLSRQNPTRQAQLRWFPRSPLNFSLYCLPPAVCLPWWAGGFPWWFALCPLSLFLVSALDFRFLVTTRFTQNIP